MVDWRAAARRRFGRPSPRDMRSNPRTITGSSRASRASLSSHASRGVLPSPQLAHSHSTSAASTGAPRKASSAHDAYHLTDDVVVDVTRIHPERTERPADRPHTNPQRDVRTKNIIHPAPGTRSTRHPVASSSVHSAASNPLQSSSSSPTGCITKPASAKSVPGTSPFYIAHGSTSHPSAHLHSGDALRSRRHRALDALALVRCLPCAAAGWVLVKRDVSVISSLFKTPWMSMWAELRGGMILLYDPDSHQHAATPFGQYHQSSGFDSNNQAARNSTRNLFHQRHCSYTNGQTVTSSTSPTGYHTPTTSSINSWITQTPDRVQSVSSSSMTMSMHGMSIGSPASTNVSGSANRSGGFRAPSSFRRDQQRKVRIVFVVSDAVVDVKNTRTFSQIYIRRPDGASLYMRLASHMESQRWSVALAVATVPYRTVKLSDFVPISPIGRGASGKVFLVRESHSGDRVALKIIPKAHVFRSTLTFQHVLNERLVLEATADLPFLVQMRYAFQSDTHLYLATSFYDGGDVFSLLQANSGRLAERHACRLVGEVILALESLHTRNIVYRDLKPENVVLDGTGHIRLADFGLAKILEPEDGLLTQTVCGTTAYAAPEMLQSRSYSFSLDMWCLGVFVYHVLTGRTPYNFKNRSMEEMEDIQRSRPIRYFPSMSQEAVSLIRGLLHLDPSLRPTLEEVKRHPFFRTIDWHALARKEPHPDNLTEFVSGGVATGIRLSPVSVAGIPSSGPGLDGAMSAPTASNQQTQMEVAALSNAPSHTASSQPTTGVFGAGGHVSGPYPPNQASQFDVAHFLHPHQSVMPSPRGPSGTGATYPTAVMAVNGCVPPSSPIFRHYSANGPGSSLHTNSSDFGFPVETAEGSTGDNEDSANLDEYLLRNINRDEWRNVSFSNDAENTVVASDHFPTILSSKIREVETVAIAGWSWISDYDATKHDDSSVMCGDGFRASADHTLIPPRPLFSRRSLPEHDRRIMGGIRRSFGDRPGASSSIYTASGLFDVGADRHMPALNSRSSDRGGMDLGLAMRRRSADSIPVAASHQIGFSASSKQIVDIAPESERIAGDRPIANELHAVTRASNGAQGVHGRSRQFGPSNSFQEAPVAQHRSGSVGAERAPRSTSSSAQATARHEMMPHAARGDTAGNRSRRIQNPAYPVTPEREVTWEFDQIRANLYADPMNTDPCRDLMSVGARPRKVDRGSQVFRRRH